MTRKRISSSIMTRKRISSLILLMIIAGVYCVLLSSCKPYLPVNPKYSYASFSMELGDPISGDIGEYVDLSEMSEEDVQFVRENTKLLLDGTEISEAQPPRPGDHTLTIMYCDHQYRQYSFNIVDNEPPVFTRTDGRYTFEGLPLAEDALDNLFDAEDNSGEVEITVTKPDVNYKKAGDYKVKAVATDGSGNKTEAEASVIVQKPEYGAHGTYVFVSISDQHLTYFVDGKAVMDCPVVTGNVHGHSTPKGTFTLIYKARNLTLKGTEDNGDTYESFVNYWMDFLGTSYGLHDATWRSNFGGDIYINGGSHGCVNMPHASAGKLYEMITPGTPILIY